MIPSVFLFWGCSLVEQDSFHLTQVDQQFNLTCKHSPCLLSFSLFLETPISLPLVFLSQLNSPGTHIPLLAIMTVMSLLAVKYCCHTSEVIYTVFDFCGCPVLGLSPAGWDFNRWCNYLIYVLDFGMHDEPYKSRK